MLTFQDCIKIGSFHKPHGFSGTLQLNFDPEWVTSVAQAGIIITGTDGLPVPWFVVKDGMRITSSGTALVDLEWIEDQASARKLCGSPVFILKGNSIPEVQSSEPAGWKGYSILDENGNHIGMVIRTENFSGNLVMVTDTLNGEKMIPWHEDLILETDQVKKMIRMVIPEGLLEI